MKHGHHPETAREEYSREDLWRLYVLDRASFC